MDEVDTSSPSYLAGQLEGREQGAKAMRDSIAQYLRACGVDHPPLPRTQGERRQFEKDYDLQVVRGKEQA